MSGCSCQENSNSSSEHVQNYALTGFSSTAASQSPVHLEGVEALRLSACVSATYDPATRKVCFSIPIYGQFCVTIPISIPISGQVKACAETCGSFIPTGLKATIYVNGAAVYTLVVWGKC